MSNLAKSNITTIGLCIGAGFIMKKLLPTISAASFSILFSFNASALTCASGYQPFSERCVSQKMADYISCVEATGGGKGSVSEEISNAGKNKKAGAASLAGSTPIHSIQIAGSFDATTEQQIARKIDQRWSPNNTSHCLKAMEASAPQKTTGTLKPTQPTASAVDSKILTCIAGIDGVIDDHPGSSSKYVTKVDINGQEVFNASILGYLSHGTPYKGPFINWTRQEFSSPIRITPPTTVIFSVYLNERDTSSEDWIGVQQIYLKCGASVYQKSVDDRKTLTYGTGGTPVGIVNTGQTRVWTITIP